MNSQRIVFLDYLRVIACFMVIMVHSCEFFFIDGDHIGIRTPEDGFWVSLVDSAFRCSVPLFVLASSYLLLPLKTDAASFYKRRFVRVVVPFLLWSLLYATLPFLWGGMSAAEVSDSLLHLLVNFNPSSGHLWFVYMLIGLYLFMPILSPWLERVGRRGEQAFLAVWFLTTFWHYIKQGYPALYGECYWNEFHAFWYFSGFIGYLVLAHYFRNYIRWSLRRSLLVGTLLFAAGYAFTAIVFYRRTFTATALQELELSWRFCSFNVVLATTGVFLMLRHCTCGKGLLYAVVKEVSRLSYGVYLMHIFLLNFFYGLVEGALSTPLTIVVVGSCTFLASCLLAKLLSYLPGSKWLIG